MNYNMSKALLILGELDNDDLNWMREEGKRQIIHPGQTLIYEGQQINALYIVLSGILSVFLGEKELARIGRGEVVGEISFIDHRPPIATVKAITESIVLIVPRLELAFKLQKDTGFASRFFQGIARCLASRMRGTVVRLGYGFELEELEEVKPQELSQPDLEHLELAQAKFDWLMQSSHS